MRKLFSSESVTEGHPDKVCDAISDAVLDEILSFDKNARVACETIATTGMVLVMGEITAKKSVDVTKVARKTIKDIGYTDIDSGFDYKTCAVLTALDEQSPDIAQGVNDSLEFKKSGDKYDQIGAGDQGLMFGYATNETEEFMPMPLFLAHKLTKRLTDVRKQGILKYLRPDGKAQVTVEYEDNKVLRVDAVVVSSQHNEAVDIEDLRKDILKEVILPTIPSYLLDENTKYYINPTGRFVIGGPHGDSGLTGRKIIVDTYGGSAPHGGGSFSGKDPTKVDRSAAYYARYAAKNIVASGLADKCEIQVAYAIGKAKPVSICVNTFNTGKLSDEKISQIATEVFDFRPLAIIEKLDLRRPIFRETTNYGHFGRSNFSWEQLDKVEELKKFF